MNTFHDFSDKKNSVCHAPLPPLPPLLPLPPLPPLLDEICLDGTELALNARKLSFDYWSLLGQLDAPYTQNFEI
jgi:hypothetical protein